MRTALARRDTVILSGGTSKGAGDLTYRIVAPWANPASSCTAWR